MISEYIAAATQSIDNGKIPIGKGGINNVEKIGGQSLVNGVLNTTYMWAGIICVIIIVIGGYIYATSQGDSSGVTRGKNAIIAAVTGLVIVTMAFTITNFLIGKF